MGTLEKYTAHTADTRLRLMFPNWLFNVKGQLLVTRCALSKKVWPSAWTNSVCGHPRLGEGNEDAVIRRHRYELGAEITPPESIYPDLRYRAIDPSGIARSEVCPVLAACITSVLQINDDEATDYQWCDLTDALHGIDATLWASSPWMVMQVINCEARKRLSAFTQLKQKNPDTCRGCEHNVMFILPDAPSGTE